MFSEYSNSCYVVKLKSFLAIMIFLIVYLQNKLKGAKNFASNERDINPELRLYIPSATKKYLKQMITTVSKKIKTPTILVDSMEGITNFP